MTNPHAREVLAAVDLVALRLLRLVVLLRELPRELLRLFAFLPAPLLLDLAALAHPSHHVVVVGVRRLAELLGGAVALLHGPLLLGRGYLGGERGGFRILGVRLPRRAFRLLGLATRLGPITLAGAEGLQSQLLADSVGLLQGHGDLPARVRRIDLHALGEVVHGSRRGLAILHLGVGTHAVARWILLA